LREIQARTIEKTVKELCIKANTLLREDVLQAFRAFFDKEEENTLPKKMLKVLIENSEIAEEKKLPLCQDTGMVAVFIEMGQDVHILGGSLSGAINSGVEEAYTEGYFRKSVVKDPLMRDNTGTNTPAVIHVDITEGDKMSISVMPKGFGSENKGKIGMLNPTCTQDDIIDFCVETVKKAGPDACPPYILGVGLGGTMDQCALLSKKALLRPINESNPEPHIAELEEKIKERSNALGIGVMGLGGISTVIGVNVKEAPTHIAGCPVAVSLCCHALRSASAEI